MNYCNPNSKKFNEVQNIPLKTDKDKFLLFHIQILNIYERLYQSQNWDLLDIFAILKELIVESVLLEK
ncbi:hypothetical protein NUACC26_010030 [Scytonema sp. NUACC26]